MESQISGKSPRFEAFGKIALLYVVVSCFWGKETALPEFSDHASYQYIFQIIVTILTALIYAWCVQKGRRGSVRAVLIVQGFLGYFIFLSVAYGFVFIYYRGVSLELQGISGLIQILVCCLLFYYSQREIRESLRGFSQEGVKGFLVGHLYRTTAIIYFTAVLLIYPITRIFSGGPVSSFKSLKPFVIAVTSAAMYGVIPQNLQVADFACLLVISVASVFAASLLLFRRDRGYVVAPILLVVLSVWVINGIKVIPFLWDLMSSGLQNYEHSSMSFLQYILAHGIQTFKTNAVWFSKLVFSSVAVFTSLFYLSAIRD
jgi:hypothetical protein